MLFQLFNNLPGRININCFICIDQNSIQVNNNKIVWFFSQSFVVISLKVDQKVVQAENNNLVFKIVVSGPQPRLLFIFFLDRYLVIYIN